MPLKVREIRCKTLLNKSDLSDFTLNCYIGCSHRCLYCYARYMKKFKPRPEDWGDFVDVKINAPEVLSGQLQKLRPEGQSVFMSSVCDAWQPLEAKYRLSRTCLKMTLEAGLSVSILTKSTLIMRDFDILAAYKTPSLGMTITTLNNSLQKVLEPYAPTTLERVSVLKKAQEKGIKIWAFLGPLIPEFSDSPANLEDIFRALAGLGLDQIYLDKLNLRWGVIDSLKKGLARYNPKIFAKMYYQCINPAQNSQYTKKLKDNALSLARKFNLSNKLTFCF